MIATGDFQRIIHTILLVKSCEIFCALSKNKQNRMQEYKQGTMQVRQADTVQDFHLRDCTEYRKGFRPLASKTYSYSQPDG